MYANKAQLLQLARDTLAHINNDGPRPTMPDTFGIARRSKHFDGIASAFPRELSAWARSWAKFEKFLDTGVPVWKIFANGNDKLPFKTFSALPLITCPGAGACLEWCYSFKAWRFANAYFRQLQNTVLLATTQGRTHIMREFRDIPHGVDLRLYVDGDMDSLSTMRYWFDLINSRPDISTYGYSKSWQLFLDWHDAGREFPTNYLLNASSGSRYDTAMLGRIQTLPVYRGTFDALPVSHKMPDRRVNPKGFTVWAKELRDTARTMGMGKVWACPGKCGDCTPTGHACGSRKFQNIPVVIGLH